MFLSKSRIEKRGSLGVVGADQLAWRHPCKYVHSAPVPPASPQHRTGFSCQVWSQCFWNPEAHKSWGTSLSRAECQGWALPFPLDLSLCLYPRLVLATFSLNLHPPLAYVPLGWAWGTATSPRPKQTKPGPLDAPSPQVQAHTVKEKITNPKWGRSC